MSKRGITLYLHVHQPWRVRDYTVFDTGASHMYFNGDADNERNNRKVFEKVADKSYRPMNALIERLLAENPEFRLSFSITGTFIEQAQAWAPDVIESFQRIIATGRAEIVAETYYHSLAFFYSLPEFERQVTMHRDVIRTIFGVETKVFRNTELAYNDNLAKWADEYGFDGILAEGWDPILEWRSPNYVYKPPNTQHIGLLLKNYHLSDDVAFRFGDRNWQDWPLHANRYIEWIETSLSEGAPLMNLFMDYETFGEHQWADTGIFDFFADLVRSWCQNGDRTFYTVSQAVHIAEPAGELSMPHTVTWADTERDLTAWLGNRLQEEAMRCLYELEDDILRSGDTDLIGDWRKLQTSDHAYYMCTKWWNDGDVHAYFSPYDSPYDAFLSYMNALRDVRYRLMTRIREKF